MSTVIQVPAEMDPLELIPTLADEPESPADERRRVMYQAANLIAVHGHHRGSFGSYETGFCALGAVKEASQDDRMAFDEKFVLKWFGVTEPEEVFLYSDSVRTSSVVRALRRLGEGETWEQATQKPRWRFW